MKLAEVIPRSPYKAHYVFPPLNKRTFFGFSVYDQSGICAIRGKEAATYCRHKGNPPWFI
ncbi:MAG: hypothetical protein ACJAR0_003695 [Candidatus Azotimanducaceae bacterium]|jgi:hypothetical protein